MKDHDDVWDAINDYVRTYVLRYVRNPLDVLPLRSMPEAAVKQVNDALRQTNCGLDCEEHAVIELALAECADSEEQANDYIEKNPSELPELVKSIRLERDQERERLRAIRLERDSWKKRAQLWELDTKYYRQVCANLQGLRSPEELIESLGAANSGRYITTYPSGTRFHFLAPTIDQVHLEDISHALSLITRFVGHVRRLYVVGEHSCRVADEVLLRTRDPIAALCGLLHDSEEAYLNDLPRPVKHLKELEPYRQISSNVKRVILTKFGLVDHYETWRQVISEVDDAMLHSEAKALSNGDWADPSKVLPGLAIGQCSEHEIALALQAAFQLDDVAMKHHVIGACIHSLQRGGAQEMWRLNFTQRFEQWSKDL